MPGITHTKSRRIAIALLPLLALFLTGSICRGVNDPATPAEEAAADRVSTLNASSKPFTLVDGTINEELPVEKKVFEALTLSVGRAAAAGDAAVSVVEGDNEVPYSTNTEGFHDAGRAGATVQGFYDWDTGRLSGDFVIVTLGTWERKTTDGLRTCEYEERFKGTFEAKLPAPGMPNEGTKVKLSISGKKDRTETLRWGNGREKTNEFSLPFAYDPDFTVAVP